MGQRRPGLGSYLCFIAIKEQVQHVGLPLAEWYGRHLLPEEALVQRGADDVFRFVKRNRQRTGIPAYPFREVAIAVLSLFQHVVVTLFVLVYLGGDIIKSGGLVLFPTETVYGLGANGLDENAVKKIYVAKNRNFNNPINLLVNSIKMIETVAQNISPLEYKLMEEFFPGPFTIILKKRNIIPNIVTANQEFVGVRMPSGVIAKTLIDYAGVPIAAPSANISGKVSGTNFNAIYEDFKDKVDCAIDGGNSEIGIESTIVKVVDNVPHILRPGSITAEQIKHFSSQVVNEYENLASTIKKW